MAKVRQCLNLSTGSLQETATFSSRSGAIAMLEHRRWMFESTLNIYTGREMLSRLFPDSRFLRKVLMTKLITLS